MECMAPSYAFRFHCPSFFAGIAVVLQKKTPILTLPQVKSLVVAALSGFTVLIIKALELVNYYLRRNFVAYNSHRKKLIL